MSLLNPFFLFEVVVSVSDPGADSEVLRLHSPNALQVVGGALQQLPINTRGLADLACATDKTG